MSASVEDRADPQETVLLDPDSLDNSKHYRFIQERPNNVAKRIQQGYEVVLRSEHGVRLLSDELDTPEEETKTADDKVRVGDTILMMCDKDLYDERRKGATRLANARLGATEEQFRQQARRRGVRSLIDDEGERK